MEREKLINVLKFAALFFFRFYVRFLHHVTVNI